MKLSGGTGGGCVGGRRLGLMGAGAFLRSGRDRGRHGI
jgi:hypothetical protein